MSRVNAQQKNKGPADATAPNSRRSYLCEEMKAFQATPKLNFTFDSTYFETDI